MALRVARTSVNLPPTVRTLASGVPSAPYIAFNRHVPSAEHGHHEHDPSGPRADVPPKWIGGLNHRTRVGLVAKSFVTVPPTTVFPHQRFVHSSARASAGVGAVPPSPTGVPDFSHYQAQSPERNRALSYFLIGSMGALTASAAKSTVTEFLSTMSATADVLALARVEVEMASIPEGKNAVIKWRGKPVFIRHRTADEIEEAKNIDWKTLRDPEPDEARVKEPEWLVMLGVCTHLGCVPIGESGDYGGWFCPCHGSHYDISGRVRKGPAPLNLEVPEYQLNTGEGKIIVG